MTSMYYHLDWRTDGFVRWDGTVWRGYTQGGQPSKTKWILSSESRSYPWFLSLPPRESSFALLSPLATMSFYLSVAMEVSRTHWIVCDCEPKEIFRCFRLFFEFCQADEKCVTERKENKCSRSYDRGQASFELQFHCVILSTALFSSFWDSFQLQSRVFN